LSDEDEAIVRNGLQVWGTENSVRRLDGRDISENTEITFSRTWLHSIKPNAMARMLEVSVNDAEKLCSFLKVEITLFR
jgi:hypothetical protein